MLGEIQGPVAAEASGTEFRNVNKYLCGRKRELGLQVLRLQHVQGVSCGDSKHF